MELILKENKEEAWSRIDKKLSGMLASQTQHSIYRVHNRYLNGTNDKAFKPAIVAIGPYHRGSVGLQMMEEHKVRCLKLLHLDNNQTVKRCISAAGEMEVEARGCYAEAISLSAAEFIEMLVLDGCFILHLLKMYNHQDSTTDYVVVDPIFKMAWAVECLKRDLILFENQIPFFVFCKLFDLIEAPNQHGNLDKMFRSFFGIGEITYSSWNNRSPHEVKHLLHLMHIIWRFQPPAPYYGPRERYFKRIPTATQLKDANVKFIASESAYSRVFQFDNGQLTISPLSIEDGKILLSNLIVYEQYFPDNEPAFTTDYAVLWDCLVDTRRDVEILSECGIIHSTMDDNQQAADIINRLTHSVPRSNFFIYDNTFRSINAHYNYRWNRFINSWNRAKAVLRRDYFNSPWAYISFAAAVLLLLLTLAQTVFSALQL